METRKNRIKVFLSDKEVGKINLFMKINNIKSNISDLCRKKLKNMYENRDTNLIKIECEDLKNNGMLILMSDSEKNLIKQLTEVHEISQSEAVRLVILNIFMR